MKAFHIADRKNANYYVADLITEVLAGGQSARLHQRLVKENPMFSSIDCYHTGSVEGGLLVVDGKILPGITAEAAEAAVDAELKKMQTILVDEQEMEKIKNKVESSMAFEDLNLLNRANNLAFYELLGDAAMMNGEFERYRKVSAEDLRTYAQTIFHENNSSTLHYLAAQ